MDEEAPHEQTGTALTILSLINGFIGGGVFTIPVLALGAGWLPSLLGLLVFGFCGWWACQTLIAHLGDQWGVGSSLFSHFGRSAWLRGAFDVTVWLCTVATLIIYYKFVCIQTEGLFASGQSSPALWLINAALLLGWSILLKIK